MSTFTRMDLLTEFREFIEKEKLFTAGDKLLLAVSGGLDSVVLTELCHRSGLDFVIAHANFQLRGEESARDEAFARELGSRYAREVLVARFLTREYAESQKVSIQVAAREQRYSWFRELVSDGSARWILTAHHLDDNIETMLMHFFKGTGIAGMRGILPKQGNIVRPLLFARKEELRAFAEEADLRWVEDSSNESDKYTRNFFRHQLIPLVEQAFPSAAANLAANLDRFRETEELYRQAVAGWKKKLMEWRGGEVHIPVEKLRRAAPLLSLVHEITEPFGFSPQQAEEVIALMDSPTGKYVLSRTHRILKNRNWLIIGPLADHRAANILVEEQEVAARFGEGELHFARVATGDVGALDQGPNVALLDAGKISYPLLLRPWKAGDYFYPLGMRKKKKLARFLIDAKVSLSDKERVWVLEMEKKLIWVIGRRIDDRWKLGPGTREVLSIRFVRKSDAPGN